MYICGCLIFGLELRCLFVYPELCYSLFVSLHLLGSFIYIVIIECFCQVVLHNNPRLFSLFICFLAVC